MCRRLSMTPVTMSDRFRERTPWTLDELDRVAAAMGLQVPDLLARPKGFEPLTFWLGADHTLTGTWPGGGWRHLFCDECGDLGKFGSVDQAAALGDVHALWKHDGASVERGGQLDERGRLLMAERFGALAR